MHNITATAPTLQSTAWVYQPILNHAVPVLRAGPRFVSSVANRVLGTMQGDVLVQSLKTAGRVTLRIGFSLVSTTLTVIFVVFMLDVFFTNFFDGLLLFLRIMPH